MLISVICGHALTLSISMFLCMGLINCHPYEKYLGAKTFFIYFISFIVNLFFYILLKGSFALFLAGSFLGLITTKFYKNLIHKSWRAVNLSHLIIFAINIIVIILSFALH